MPLWQDWIKHKLMLLVQVWVEGPDPCVGDNPPKTMTIRPLMGDREEELPVMAAWGVIDLTRETHVIEILNPTKLPVTLPIGTPVAVEENVNPEIHGETIGTTDSDQPVMATTTDDTLAGASSGGGDGSSPTTKTESPLCEDLDSDGEDDEPTLDGARFSVSLKGSVLDRDQRHEFAGLCEEFGGVFAKDAHDLGTTTLMHHYIDLTTDKPIHAPQYKAPPPDVRQEIDQETNELLAMGVARESNSPYSAPIVLVKKKLGGWRYCTDFRKLNRATVKASFPLPNIEDSIRRFKTPRVISTMDLLKGYWQVPIAEGHRKFFAFSDGKRHLEYVKCPMGAKNSGATMAALMELVLRGLPTEYVLAYLDDLIVATPDVETHFAALRSVFKALADAGLKVHPGKCLFFQKKATVLGFVISEKGIEPDPNNLRKVEMWPVPRNESEVRSFIGLANYYRSHIPGFAKIATPLTDLLAKDQPFIWGAPQQKAYEDLKGLLLKGTACAFPDFKEDFFLKTDASETTVGAVLAQKDERNRERMVACASQKLNTTERKWSTYDREFWAIVWGVCQFSHYLRFRPFVCYTDHRPLLSCRSVDTDKDATGRRTRWAIELASYEMDLRHKEGRRNADADALSRAPHPDEAIEDHDQDTVFLGAMTSSEGPSAELVADVDDSLRARIVKGQDADPDISLAKQWLKKGPRKPSPQGLNTWFITGRSQLRVIDGVLYHCVTDKRGERHARVVVPYSMIRGTPPPSR